MARWSRPSRHRGHRRRLAAVQKHQRPYRTLTSLDVSAYLNSADSLRGNVYKLNGTVANQLAWAPNKGRLYSVDVNERDDILALLIPAEFNSLNIQKGQHYFFKIEVGDKGILRVRDIRKV